MEKLSALQAGEAGESYVMFELLRMGVAATMCSQFGTYDILADVDRRPIRIQVKTAKGIQDGRNVYRFGTCKGSDKRLYKKGDFDIAAYVALDIPAVVFRYGPSEHKMTSIPVDGFYPKSGAQTWKRALGRFVKTRLKQFATLSSR